MEASSEKRMHERIKYSGSICFTILFMQSSEFKRMRSCGEILDVSRSGLGLKTEFPLDAGYILEWDDEHRKGKLHVAMVKWSQKTDDSYRAGLKFI
ncbi:MAG: PilZ domain-containing protein [Nitrospirae bacterium]|nr:PilZ domain-containing protein [Nitrospirota bacterium]